MPDPTRTGRAMAMRLAPALTLTLALATLCAAGCQPYYGQYRLDNEPHAYTRQQQPFARPVGRAASTRVSAARVSAARASANREWARTESAADAGAFAHAQPATPSHATPLQSTPARAAPARAATPGSWRSGHTVAGGAPVVQPGRGWAPPAPGQPDTRAQRETSAFVKIHVHDGRSAGVGTGFLVHRHGGIYLVTAKHVLSEGMNRLRFYDHTGQPVRLRVGPFRSHRSADVAAAPVLAHDPRLEVHEIYTGRPMQRGECLALGMAEGVSPEIHHGQILGSYYAGGHPGEPEGYMSSSWIRQGMSGGPLLYEGKVIGVNSAATQDSDTDRQSFHANIRYALPLMR